MSFLRIFFSLFLFIFVINGQLWYRLKLDNGKYVCSTSSSNKAESKSNGSSNRCQWDVQSNTNSIFQFKNRQENTYLRFDSGDVKTNGSGNGDQSRFLLLADNLFSNPPSYFLKSK